MFVLKFKARCLYSMHSFLVEVGSSQPKPVLSKPSGKVSPYSVPGGTKPWEEKGEQIIHQHNSSQCTSFTLTFISRDSGEIGAEEEREREREKEKKKREAPRYKRRGGAVDGESHAGRPGGLCFLLRVAG